MTSVSLPSKNQDRSFPVFFLTAISISFIFGFVDEGYYDLSWMQNIGNWIALGIYTLTMLIGQLVFFNIFLSRYSGKGKMAMSVIFGCILGAGSLMAFFYGI